MICQKSQNKKTNKQTKHNKTPTDIFISQSCTEASHFNMWVTNRVATA